MYKRRHSAVRFVRQAFYKVYNFFKTRYWRICKPKTQGVKIMVFNAKREILLARIGYMHKLWVIPGGKLEKNETVEAAAARELYEEVGVKVETIKPLFTIYHEKQGAKSTNFYFEAISDTNDFVIDDEEIIDVGWFSLAALPESRSPLMDEAILKYNTLQS